MDPIYELLFYSCILLCLIFIYYWNYGNESIPDTIIIDDKTLKTLKGHI